MSDYIKDAYKKVYQHAAWEKEAKAYEENLSVMLFRNSYVMNAAQTALSRVSQVLTAYFGPNGGAAGQNQLEGAQELSDGIAQLADGKGDSATASQAEQLAADAGTGEETQPEQQPQEKVAVNRTLTEAFLRNDRESAGQIGKSENEEENLDKVDAVINRDGNFREKMTMLFNAMLYNSSRGDKSDDSITLKRMFVEIGKSRNLDKDTAAFQHLDLTAIQSLGGSKGDKDIYSTDRMMDKMGRLSRKEKRWAAQGISSRAKKSKDQQTGLGYEYYKKLGIKPSKRERAFASTKIDGVRHLAWKEGQAWTTMKSTRWVKGRKKKGFQLIAGPSGTTMRMLSAYRLLGANPDELLAFRLALIGWMGSSKDHSLYEILYGSHLVGIKGKEDLSEAARMYMSVDPISISQLRNYVAIDQQFPHERVFTTMLDEVAQQRKDNKTLTKHENGDQSLTSAQDKALNIYTTSAYRVMNRSTQYNNRKGWQLAVKRTKSYLSKNTDVDENDLLYVGFSIEELEDKKLSRSIRRSIRVAAALGQDALRERSQNGRGYTGTVFRGMGLPRRAPLLHKGETFTLSSLTSTSKNKDIAKRFYSSIHPPLRPVFVELQLTGRSGIELGNVSQLSGEQEVLLPNGTKFTVTEKEHALSDGGKIYNYVKLQEASGPSDFTAQVEQNQQIEDSFQAGQIAPAAAPPNPTYDILNLDLQNDVLPLAPAPSEDTQIAGNEPKLSTITLEQRESLIEHLANIQDIGHASIAYNILSSSALDPELIFEHSQEFVDALASVIPEKDFLALLSASDDTTFAAILTGFLKKYCSQIEEKCISSN